MAIVQLTVPQFCVEAIQFEELPMRTRLCHLTVLQHEDPVTVIYGAQAMRNEDARSLLLLEDASDVLQQSLLCVGVECRSLCTISTEL